MENFPPYFRSFLDNRATNIMDELQQIRYKKPDDRPKFTSELLQLALVLCYTLLPACQLLVKHFILPSVRLLKRLSQGGMEPLKAVKLLLKERKIDKDIVLLTKEMYLQKEFQFQQGKLIGCDDNGDFLSIRENVGPTSSRWIPARLASGPPSSCSAPVSVSVPFQLFLRWSSTALFPFLSMCLHWGPGFYLVSGP